MQNASQKAFPDSFGDADRGTVAAIAVCQRAAQELSLLDDDEGSVEIARDQMRQVWRSLEAEVRRGTVDLSATVVLRKYIKAHWRFPADELPAFDSRPEPPERRHP